jgi:alpha-galactosidase
MPRVTFVGAGSVTFTHALVSDLLRYPELLGGLELVLHDVDPRRLEVAEAVVRRLASSAEVSATLDRRRALDGADYVLFTVQVGGHEATLRDFEIPKRHGIRATIGDTVGIGGVFRALRTFPVICGTAEEIAELCPDAWLLNYTNPMAMLCWAVYDGTPVDRVVGLCHSVQHTAAKLSKLLGVDELEYEVAGVNHLAFFLSIADREGRELSGRLAAAIASDPDGIGRTVRAELFRMLGYFVTESSEHAAEYVPWFLGDAEAIERFRIPLDEYPRRSAENLEQFERAAAGGSFPPSSGDEYAPAIIHAIETGTPFQFNGNVRNDGLIANLPQGACVEVPCVADGTGVRAQAVGELPPQLAALDRAYLNVVELAVRGYLERRPELIYMACAADPGVSGQSATLDEIRSACDELYAASAGLRTA